MKYVGAPQQTGEGCGASVRGLAATEEALERIRDTVRAWLAARDDLLQGAAVREVNSGS